MSGQTAYATGMADGRQNAEVPNDIYGDVVGLMVILYAFMRRELPAIRREHPEWFVPVSQAATGTEGRSK